MRWKLTAIGMAFIAIVVSVACAVLTSQYEERMSKVERDIPALRKTNNQQTTLLTGVVEIQGLQSDLMKAMAKNQAGLVKIVNRTPAGYLSGP